MVDTGEPERDLGRLAAFNDGVLIVSMTLLVLDIRLPDDLGSLEDGQLGTVLWNLVPNYFGYVLSFLVIGNYWLRYTDKFGRLRRVDSRFVWLNIYFLLVIGFIPFVTSVLSRSEASLATILYAATMTAASLLLTLMWLYAESKQLLQDAPLSRDQRVRRLIPSLTVTGVFALSIPIALIDSTAGRLFWLTLVLQAFIGKGGRTPDHRCPAKGRRRPAGRPDGGGIRTG